MASAKAVVDEAYPGDVVGLYDTGNFKIGDTLTEGEDLQFQGIPSFSPEIFKELQNNDPMKSKQLEKGIQQLTDEGVAQLFVMNPGNRKIVGTVGELQFEVIQYRLEHEYGAKASFVPKRVPQGVLADRRRGKDCRVQAAEGLRDGGGQGRQRRLPRPLGVPPRHGARQLSGDHLPHNLGVQDRPSGVNSLSRAGLPAYLWRMPSPFRLAALILLLSCIPGLWAQQNRYPTDTTASDGPSWSS